MSRGRGGKTRYDDGMQEFVRAIEGLLAEGHVAEARARSEAAPEAGQAALGRALIALHEKDAASLVLHAGQASARMPGEALPLHLLMIGEGILGHTDAAVVAGRQALGLGIDASRRVAIGHVLLGAGHWDEAHAVFAAAIDAPAARVEALVGMGLCLGQRHEPAEAARAFAQALTAQPADRRPLAGVLHLLRSLGESLGAIQAAQLLLEEPLPAETQVLLRLTIYQLTLTLPALPLRRSFEPERRAAAKALAASVPPVGRALKILVVRALLDGGSTTEARALLGDLLEEVHNRQERAELLVLQGYLADREGQPAHALTFLQTALRLDGARADAAAVGVALLLDQADGDITGRVRELLSLVTPEARARSVGLLLQEARHDHRQGAMTSARERVQEARALAHTADDMAMVATCDELLASLSVVADSPQGDPTKLSPPQT